jgi:hypothetical protein
MHQVMIAYIVTNANYLLVLMKEINTVVDMNYAISFLLDSIFFRFGITKFRPMGANCAPLIADLFSCGNESC